MPPSSQFRAARHASFETATALALLATLILAGIFFIPLASIPLVSTKAFILAIGAIITLALFILARLSRGNIILPPPLLLGALWLPTIAYALSAVFSGASFSRAFLGAGFSTDTLGFMAVMSILGTLTALAFRRVEHYQLFIKAVFGFALFVTIVQLAFVIVGQFMPATISPNSSLLGSIVDLSSFAGLTVIGVLLSMRLMTVRGRARLALFLVAAISLFILALFNARLEWVIVALVSLGLFVEAVMRRVPSGSDSDLEGTAVVAESDAGIDAGEHSLIAPLVTLAVALFFLLGGNLSGILANVLHVSVLDVRPSWQSTLSVGQQVYASSPIFGSGPTTFVSEWLKYRDASLNQTIFWNVDFNSGIGFIPTSFITTGLIGLIAWILLAVALLYLGARAIVLKTTSDPYLRFITILSFASTMYLGVVAVAANAGAVSLSLLFVFAGLFASTLRYVPGKVQWGIIFSKSPRIGFVIVFALTIVLLASIVGAYTLVEHYLAQLDTIGGTSALASNNLSTAKAQADNSVALVPSSDAYRLQARVAQGTMAKIANDGSITAAVAQQSFQQELAAGITAALNATRSAPDEYQNWITLGDLYATVVPLKVTGAYDNALAAYQKAAALNPTSPLIPYSMAQLHIAQSKADDARIALTKAITLKQDYTPAIFLLSQLEVATGNIADALKAAEAAAYFTPNDAGILFQVGVLRAATGDTAGATTALTSAVTISPQFANAHYFLAALYAKKGDYAKAKSELQAIAAVSAENAKAVAPLITQLSANKNPFPANLLSTTPPSL
jgi:tetratricopeptide (TPR) repeat protein